MTKWQSIKLGDVVNEVTVGHVGSMTSEYRASGIPFLRSQNVRPHRIDLSDVKYIDEDFHATLRKSTLRPGDVVTVRTGAPGQSAVVPDWLEIANCSDLVIFRAGPSIDPRWLSYYLNFVTKTEISGLLVGAVQQHFNVKSAKNLDVKLPPTNEQRAIAEVLGALDDKIAVNDRLITISEKVAIAYASGATKTTEVGRVATHSTRSSSPDKFQETVAHYSLPAFDSSAQPSIEPAQSIKSNKFTLAKPSVLISKLNPRIPRVWNVSEIGHIQAVASTEFVVLEPIGYSTSVLWSLLCQQDVTAYIASRVAGTSGSHQRVKPAEILSAPVGDPDSLNADIRELIDGLGMRIEGARKESQVLARTRDELLPLLMSGKLRVKDAEKKVEAIA